MNLLNKKENQLTFTAEIEETLANSIRRYLNHIPILAVDEVEISKNDSPLYDETVAHRIGLIPLKLDKSITEKKIPTLKLEVKNEGNVYSKSLTGGVKVVYDNIPITALDKNQELKLTASMRFGKGNEHSRFSPGLMFYTNVEEVKIGKDLPKEAAEMCPQEFLNSDEKKIIVTDPLKQDMIGACAEICHKHGKDACI
ncbi:MAG: hypothetical protein Q8P15_02245, partial [Nanoarchaeota archaeon]|nr:hypothetical protein [Nanoarchaeota archaeon]